LYFHTKGASHHLSRPKDSLENLKQWRRFIEYFNIERWSFCVNSLNNVDACGTDWEAINCNTFEENTSFCGLHLADTRKLKPHFSGNFWWANASYVNQCTLIEDNRFSCELFIGMANPKVEVFLSSILNPKLREYFTEEEIQSMKSIPDNNIFDWRNHFYHPAFYRHEKHFEIEFLEERIRAEVNVDESQRKLAHLLAQR
jgi:hypothetical protein